jgi:hypothetical protein
VREHSFAVVRGAAVVSDALRDFLEGGFGAAGEVDVGALAGVGSRDGRADRAAPP